MTSAVLSVESRPPDDAARPCVEHDGAVDLPLTGTVLVNVCDPQFVTLIAVKLALNPVRCGDHARDEPEARPAGKPLHARTTHQELDRLWPMTIPRPSVSSAWTRRMPYVSREAACTWRMTSVIHAWRIARGAGARERRA